MSDAASRPSCHDLRLEVPGFTELVAAEQWFERQWRDAAGDTLVLRTLEGPSRFAGAGSAQELAERLEAEVLAEGGDWSELKITRVQGRPAVLAVLKHPQADEGTRYTALLHLPLEGFAVELRLACEERGELGQREQTLLNRVLGETDQWTMAEGGRIELLDWDPENPRHDAQFPDHPLSRARRGVAAIQEGLGLMALEGVNSVALPGAPASGAPEPGA
ncbi:MAG: hypothetical protein H6741_08255 [Alphaproteobacteria bacterium]|nr:hypothetical protein [Alphaproteobacteria bacterium]